MASITQFEYIIAVNKTKHFGRAAKLCNVSQPSLSAQIQKVEEELGIIIFDRSKKPVIATDRGLKVIEQARHILREYKGLFSIQGEGSEITGDFQLGVIPTLSAYIIPLFIELFSKKYPKVNLTIKEHQTEEIIERLHNDELDGGLLVTPLHEEQIIERSLFLEPFYAFVSENHKLANRKIIKDSELSESSVWLLNEGHCLRTQALKICHSKNKNQVLKNVQFESGNLETLKNLVKKGSGYTFLPLLATLNLSNNERNKHLRKFSRPIPTREVSLVHSRSFLKEEILRALELVILESIPKEIKSLKRGGLDVIEIY